MQFVAHAMSFGTKIRLIIFIRFYLYRHILHYLEAEAVKARTLSGVIGDEAHLLDAYLAEDLGTYAIVALIGGIAEVYVGINSVEALLL